LLSSLAAAIAAAIVAALVAAGVITLIWGDISETENHLIGINAAKYLNNQLIIDDLGPGTSAARDYEDDQVKIKYWFLLRMRGFLQKDFIEYNAHPYQRHSIESIRNLWEFAHDEDLRNGAALVLDYTAAKFAVASSQGRRMVPYRRHRSDLSQTIDA